MSIKKIFEPGMDLNLTITALQNLTKETDRSYDTHDFRFTTWGHAIEVKPTDDAPGALFKLDIYTHNRVKDGDMFITTSRDGRLQGMMMFDVEPLFPGSRDFQAMGIVFQPELGIGRQPIIPTDAHRLKRFMNI